MQKVYIVDIKKPWKVIKQRTVRIIIGPKRTWASNNGRRHLIGSSAFFTKAAADRCKFTLLTKIISSNFLHNQRRAVYDVAKQQLQSYYGTFR